MSRNRKKKLGFVKKTKVAISMALVLSPQTAQIVRIASASAPTTGDTSIQYVTIPMNKKYRIDFGPEFDFDIDAYNSSIIKITTSSGNSITIEPLKEGSTYLSMQVYDSRSSKTHTFVIRVIDSGIDGRLDVGDIVKYIQTSSTAINAGDIRKLLNSVEPAYVPSLSSSVYINLPPHAFTSQAIVVYNPTSVAYAADNVSLYNEFTDPNGTSDLVGFSIFDGPNPASGMSVSISGATLHIGGTPTMPTSFRVRAMDSQGLYAEKTYALNFAPEAVAQPSVIPSGTFVSVGMSSYFLDRDGDRLNYMFLGPYSSAFSAWTYGSVLYVNGEITRPVDLSISAWDGYADSWTINTVSLAATNYKPVAWNTHALVVYNPTSVAYAADVVSLYNEFTDLNGTSDLVGFTIIDGPNPSSGMSVSINGSTLHIGGTPTMPTSFRVRATDSQGQYAEKTYALNFAPEAVAQPPIAPSSDFTNIDLGSYFTDRDGDGLEYWFAGPYSSAYTAWISGSSLYVDGQILRPVELRVGAWDSYSNYTAYNTVSLVATSYAPTAWNTHSIVVYNPTSTAYATDLFGLYDEFHDRDGTSDLVGFSIVDGPNPASGMSVSISGSTLHIGGTPTMPTSFRVRATDSQGLYAEKTYALNFTPEAVAQPPITPSADFTNIDLGSYFADRDGDGLEYWFAGPYSSAYSAWISGSSLYVAGRISHPVELRIGAGDHYSSAYNTVSLAATNYAPTAWNTHAIVVYNPMSTAYATDFFGLYDEFNDRDGTSDLVGFSIVDGPNPASSMSVSINGATLHIGGTPTMPTSFRVRATDSQGQYAEKTYALNFAPEAVTQPPVSTSGTFVSVNISGYFLDRDGDGLDYWFAGPYSSAYSAWTNGSMLYINGMITKPVELRVIAYDSQSGHGALNTVSLAAANYAPEAWNTHAIVVYNPTSVAYATDSIPMHSEFTDPNGTSDLVGFTIVDGPNPSSGMSVSINGATLHIGGTPTMPTSFRVRATDSGGLYAEKTYALNFAPEAVTQPPISISGTFVSVNMSGYFLDRDGDGLDYWFAGPYSSAYSAWTNGSMLYINGMITKPVELRVIAYDNQSGHGAVNTVSLAAANYAPEAWNTHAIVVYNPTSVAYATDSIPMHSEFTDPNGTSDLVGFTIVDGPNPASGMSVSINGSTLHIGGTPTMPTSFRVRATDSRGLYAEKTYALNFAPEAVAQPPVSTSGTFVSVNMSGYFLDRDGDGLDYWFAGPYSSAYWAWTNGSMLYINGMITKPVELRVIAYDSQSGHGALNTVSLAAANYAPEAWNTHAIVVYNPTSVAYATDTIPMHSEFTDPNGTSDLVGFTIVDGPNPSSGMSVSINGATLHIGGTPTMPTSFRVRATDSRGLYAEKTYALNFAPEAVAQPPIIPSSDFTNIDLGSYFTDRDGDGLEYWFAGPYSSAYAAWISGSSLYVDGRISRPVELRVGARDSYSNYTALNTVSLAATNYAPTAWNTHAIVVYNPTSVAYAFDYIQLHNEFTDPNGTNDLVGFSIVDGPNPDSGMSVSISDSTLQIGGTPTMPTSFRVRATDSGGQYAEKTYALNFAPEAVAQPPITPSSDFTNIDLGSYFTDRDGDGLEYWFAGPYSSAYAAWISGSSLYVDGRISRPVELRVGARDSYSNYTVLNTVSLAAINYAPTAWNTQAIVVYNPTSTAYATDFFGLYDEFNDRDGTSDLAGFSIVDGPNPASGMSVSINGSTLQFGGTPTMPTTFRVRATDSQGRYAEKTYAINFTPEAVAQPPIIPSSDFTNIDLGSYFTDRDGDGLEYWFAGPYSSAYAAWISGSSLYVDGRISRPVELRVGARDSYSNYTALNTVSLAATNYAPTAWNTQAIVVYNPTSTAYATDFFGLYDEFNDRDGTSDLAGFSIVDGPNPASGMSVSINGSTLQFGGTPTMPTSFRVRATDSQGLYAEKTYTLNFTPEAVAQPPIIPSGDFTNIDLGSYFIDRDGDGLEYWFAGPYSSAYAAWISGSSLYVDGRISRPVELRVGARDSYSNYTVLNTVSLAAINYAPTAWNTHAIVVYNPTSTAYATDFFGLYDEFHDRDGTSDLVGFTIVDGPNPASGMSVSISGSTLHIGGTPTRPTSFRVRATDSHGLYAEKTYSINFAPEAVAQPPVSASGTFASVDLSSYFIDRDGDGLAYTFVGPYSSAYSAWIDGNVLYFSGVSTTLVFRIMATDGYSWTLCSVRLNQ
ncbi:hypothetical protein [Cohnella sp. GCM10027633]|uniref:hypothetical protein n=1 Tax=unclassified Cohnella TaxID=2636738 RepID=UPI00362F8A91